jgi:hypothetical protein
MQYPVTPAPTMSTQGWVTDPSLKFDTLLADFFLADPNQSYLYKGTIKTLQGLIEKYGNNIGGLIGDLEVTLKVYFERYYDMVQVSVQPANDIYTDPQGQLELKISIGVNDRGTQKQYGRLLQASNGAMQKIKRINENGY